MPIRWYSVLVFAALALTSSPAYAYIGPGMGAGAIAVVLGILGSIIMAFFAILWYPIKRLLKKRKPAKATKIAIDRPDRSSNS